MNKHLNGGKDNLNKVQNENFNKDISVNTNESKSEKAEKISGAIGALSEKTVSDTDRKRKLAADKTKKTAYAEAAGIWRAKKIWIPAVSAAACGAIVLGTVFGSGILKNNDMSGSIVHNSDISEHNLPQDSADTSVSEFFDSGFDMGYGHENTGSDTADAEKNAGNGDTDKNILNSGVLSHEDIKKAFGIESPGMLDMSEYTETLNQAEYPFSTPYPIYMYGVTEKLGISNAEWWNYEDSLLEAWTSERKERFDADEALDSNALNEFNGKTANIFLKNSEGENRVYSPANIYLAFSMLAELTDGESRNQLLSLTGFDGMEDLRKQASNLWKSLYCNDGINAAVLANSLWLQNGLDVNTETVNRLADEYYASVFRGDLGSAETSEAFKKWLNDQTGGLLEDKVNGIELSPETVMALCSTVYFHGTWKNEFYEFFNENMTFHGYSGDKETVFMNTIDNSTLYGGEDYTAAELKFDRGGKMWFILPDEDKSIDGVLKSGEFLRMIDDPEGWENKALKEIDYSVPKFDISSDFDLREGLKSLGAEDIFDADKADFSPFLIGGDELAVSSADHAARVVIDEKGCTAAAYTVIEAAGGSLSPEYEKAEFVLDRPFLFVITGDTGNVLFLGTVYEIG